MALVVKIRGDATHFEKTMARVQGSVGGVAKGMLRLTMQTAAFGAALLGIGGGLAVVSKFVELMKDSSGKAAGMETLTLQFETLTGSASKAVDLISKFREEAQKSPLSTTDYASAGKTLLTFGVATEKALPTLKMLGDVSLGNAERFHALALAFAQTQAAGRLMGQEVLQFVNAGFNPLQQISKKTGISMAVLKQEMEDGAISADMVTQAFKDATSAGGLFYRAIDRGAATTEGQIAKLKDTIDMVKIGLGTGINQGLVAAIPAIDQGISSLEGRAKTFGVNIGHAIAQAVAGHPDIFVNTGALIGEYLVAGMKTSLDQMWVNFGLAVSRKRGPADIGHNLENESYAATFDRYSDGVRAAQEALRQSLPGGGSFADTENQIRKEEMRADRERTEALLKEVEKGTKTMQQMLDELRKDKPMFKR